MAGGPQATLRFRRLDSIGAVDACAWDALFDPAYPFTRHAFLHALERTRCVSPRHGWSPAHLVAQDDAGAVVAAAPLYLKSHSFGEFVFDFAWAQAAGRGYYPKLVCAIPFTPAEGPRLGAISPGTYAALAAELARLAGEPDVSSLHALFPRAGDAAALAEHGFFERADVQFHWHNRGYDSFDAFAATLRADKRKKVLRERRRVAEAGLRFEWRHGEDLAESEWHAVYALYANTYEERGQAPYLHFEFFLDYGARPGNPLRLCLCHEGERIVAVAITAQGADTLYGRHWGAADRYHSLHFETCYYQGIERCIAEKLARFDAGAQGEHKLARGFDPVPTRSLHRLRDARLHAAIQAHVRRERAWVESRRRELQDHVPYKRADG